MFCNGGWIHLSQPRIFLPQDARNHLPGLVTLQTSSLLCQRHLTDGSTFSFIFSQTRLPYFVKAINPYCSSNISQLLLLKTRSGSQCHVIVQEKYKVVSRRVLGAQTANGQLRSQIISPGNLIMSLIWSRSTFIIFGLTSVAILFQLSTKNDDKCKPLQQQIF